MRSLSSRILKASREELAQLEAEIQKITLQPDFLARIRELGYEPGGTPQGGRELVPIC